MTACLFCSGFCSSHEVECFYRELACRTSNVPLSERGRSMAVIIITSVLSKELVMIDIGCREAYKLSSAA